MRLRSANRGNSYNAWYQNAGGYLNNNNALNANRFAPVCVWVTDTKLLHRRGVPALMTQRAEIPARKGEQRRGDTNNFFTNLGVIYIMEPTEDNAILEKVVGFDALYESMLKCIRGYLYKDSVAHFFLNGIESVLKLEAEHKNGTYKARKPHKFKITFPKPRDAVSISFRDRVYQRSLNDNVIYPIMSQQFIQDNFACQKGKGTDPARNRLVDFLRRYYRKHGTDGYVLQCDVKGYYPNMPHEVAEERFQKNLPPVIFDMVQTVLRDQYDGDVGYNPGSQMIQIAGISVLSPLDHMVKERLHIKCFLRYMDDFDHIHHDKKHLEMCKDAVEKYLTERGMHLHPNKTKIYPLTDGIVFLGFKYRLTDTGKVVITVSPDNVKHERKRLARMVAKAKRGEISKKKVDECYKAWKAHACKGDSFRLLCRMDQYYKDLWRKQS